MNPSIQNKIAYNGDSSFKYITKKTHRVRLEKAKAFMQKYINSLGVQNTIKLLDTGCGDGSITQSFIDLHTNIELHGIDIADQSLKKAAQAGIHTKCCDVTEKFPFKDETFDIVFSGEIIEHIADPRTYILEINRILKSNGLLVITTPNLGGLNDRLRFLFGRTPRHTNALSADHYLHIRPFTYHGLREILEKGGFKIQQFASNKIRFNPFSSPDIDSYFLSNILPGLGAALIVSAIKVRDENEIELKKI